MTKVFVLAVLLFFLPALFYAQSYCIRGEITDKDTGKPLAFVNIVNLDKNTGAATDIDGRFKICANEPFKHLKLTYVGYKTLVLELNPNDSFLEIEMEVEEYELPELEIFPAENPAHRIIQNVVENRKINDPEQLPAFTYTSYDKMIFTLDPDTIFSKIDSIKNDTSEMEFRNFLEEHHLFLMESVSERKYLYPDHNREDVIATKVSGFKDPIFVFLLSQMQSTSFYNERISISEKNYVNPISKGSTKKYFFLLQDTLYNQEGDSIFIISYRPRKGTNFDGLKGTISINSNRWAIQNVIAEPAVWEGMITLRMEQLYTFLGGKQWFPLQLKTEVYVKGLQIGRSEVIVGADSARGPKSYTLPLGTGKSYIRDVNLNPDISLHDFNNIAIDVKPGAYRRDSTYWTQYRIDSLTGRERNTYHFLDSLGEAEHFDRMARSFESIFSGEIPYGFINLDLKDFIHYNDYEGFYLGAGAHTNHRFLHWMKIGGYWGYGFRDKTAKYGGDISITLARERNLKTRFRYFYDVMESGGVRFFTDPENPLNPENFRDLLINRMNPTEKWEFGLSFRALKHFTFEMAFGETYKKAYDNYRFGTREGDVSLLMNEFYFTDLTLATRFAYNEKFVRTSSSIVSLGTKYPVFTFQYTRGFDNLLNGMFDYSRFDLQIEESFYTNYFGETSVRIRAGYIDGDLPYSNLYNGHGSYRPFTIFAPSSFATMRMNEFLSNRYIALYFTHDFGNLLYQHNRFKPEILFTTNIAFGSINNPGMHFNTSFKTLEKGYYESGIMLNHLLDLKLYNLGLGVYYRYGPYSYTKTSSNFAWKFSVIFPF